MTRLQRGIVICWGAVVLFLCLFPPHSYQSVSEPFRHEEDYGAPYRRVQHRFLLDTRALGPEGLRLWPERGLDVRLLSVEILAASVVAGVAFAVATPRRSRPPV